MNLQPPPLWEHLLLERPWPLVVALLVGAILLRYVARQRNQPVVGHVALGLALVAGGVFALAWSVTTDRQQIERHTRDLVQATVTPADFDVIDRLLSPDVVLVGPDGDVWLEAGPLRRQLETVVDRYGIDDQIIRDFGVETTGDHTGRSAIDLRTYSPGMVAPSVWTLHWRRTGDDTPWRVVRIQWNEFMGNDPPRRW
ncbi:MAG: hypothetical protein WDZ31_04870 [Phycisphaeraceae bacterium]